jgi:hypothetical protein
VKHGKCRQQSDTRMGSQKRNLCIVCSFAFEFHFEARNPRVQLIDQSKRMFTLYGIHSHELQLFELLSPSNSTHWSAMHSAVVEHYGS